MARTLSEIYSEAKDRRNEYLQLTEFEVENSSKMSVMDAFTWVVAACIWAFENILEVFKVDLAKDLQNRINGTPAYFAKALLKYQSGDTLVMNDDGTTFAYPNYNEEKRIITKVSYFEEEHPNFHDKIICFKIATGEPGNYSRIDEKELVAIRAYLNQLLFAGQQAKLSSRIGDILVPKLNVYYDGEVTEDEVYEDIEAALNEFVSSIEFNGVVYRQRVIDSIQSVAHVTDVEIDLTAPDPQGVFIASYDDDNNLIEDTGHNVLRDIGRYTIPNSGYLKESTKAGTEAGIPKWRETIYLKVETARPTGGVNSNS